MDVRKELEKRGIAIPEVEPYRWGDSTQACNKEEGYSLGVSDCVKAVAIPLLEQIKALEIGINRMADAARVAGGKL